MIRLRWTSSRSNWTAAAASAVATSGASTSPRISPLLRSRTTRQRRLIRPASFAGLSFLLERRGVIAANIASTLPRIEWGRMADMVDHPHTIDRWDDATGENLIEQIAAVGGYLVALETYRAVVKRWPTAKITLRNRARIIERSWED
jgi:hypothetical protein